VFSFLKPYVHQHLIVLALEAQPSSGVWFHQRRDEVREHVVAHDDTLNLQLVFTDDNVYVGSAR
jgi:c-di-GMP-binding flagellar brake protein YcgR